MEDLLRFTPRPWRVPAHLDELVSAHLHPADHLCGLTVGIHSGYERFGGGVTATGSVITRAVNEAALAIDDGRHISTGQKGIALQVPRTPEPLVLALTVHALSFWHLGPGHHPLRAASIPRRDLYSVHRTGRRVDDRAEVRMSFADGSFVDYDILDHGRFDEFLLAVALMAA